MGGATTSTSGTRSPVRCSSFRGSRSRKGEVLFRSLPRLRLLLARLSLRLFGRRRRRVRLSLIGNSVSYKDLLVLRTILLINSTNLPVKQKFRGKRGKAKLSLCLISQETSGSRFNGRLTSQLLKAECLSSSNGHSVRYSTRHRLKGHLRRIFK